MVLLRLLPRLLAVCLVACLALSACSTVGVLNAVLPRDAGSQKLASDVAYGGEARQKLDVYGPKGKPRGVVVFLYGGGWDNGAKGDYGFVAASFASRGYLTIVPDYRLVPEIRYPAFVEDTAKATAWAHRHAADYGAPAAPLFLVGYSAGAYNVMMVAIAPEFLRAEGLSRSILAGVAGISGPYDFLPLDARETRAAFGAAADLKATQPVNRIRPGGPRPPVFLATGLDDHIVPPVQTEALAGALQRAGWPVETHAYAGAGHVGAGLALSRPFRGIAPIFDDLIAYLERNR